MSQCHESAQRDSNGRFVSGNRGGPGNPFARQVAALRQTLLDCVTSEEFQAVGRKLVELAMAGNVPAIKLLLAYTVGKPKETVEPDQLDSQEWDLMKQTAAMTEEVPKVVKSLEPDMVINMGRQLRPVLATPLRLDLIDKLLYERDLDPIMHRQCVRDACPDEAAEWALEDEMDRAAPSPIGKTAAAPARSDAVPHRHQSAANGDPSAVG